LRIKIKKPQIAFWEKWEANHPEIQAVAKQFVVANRQDNDKDILEKS
jgi:hypothetical protein